jgi:RimJ/RimL family protein N-acetyltransferase
MFELTAGEFARALPLFQDLPHIPPRSTLLGNTPGRVFVDQTTNPQAALVWTRWGFAYLAGEPLDPSFTAALCDQILPELLAHPYGREQGLLLYPCSPAWESSLAPLLAQGRPSKLYRRAFTFNPARFSDHYGWLERLPSGFHIYRIDAQLLEHSKPQLQAEIESAWASTQDFLDRGFGFCLLHGQQIVSLCTSPFVAGRQVELCIRTDPHYRSKGFATATALAFIEHCLFNDLQPHWECPWDHVASCALAARLGFANPSDYLAYYWPTSSA